MSSQTSDETQPNVATAQIQKDWEDVREETKEMSMVLIITGIIFFFLMLYWVAISNRTKLLFAGVSKTNVDSYLGTGGISGEYLTSAYLGGKKTKMVVFIVTMVIVTFLMGIVNMTVSAPAYRRAKDAFEPQGIVAFTTTQICISIITSGWFLFFCYYWWKRFYYREAFVNSLNGNRKRWEEVMGYYHKQKDIVSIIALIASLIVPIAATMQYAQGDSKYVMSQKFIDDRTPQPPVTTSVANTNGNTTTTTTTTTTVVVEQNQP